MSNLRLGLTIGNFNGIGPEILVKVLQNKNLLDYTTPVVYTNKFILKFYAELYEIRGLRFNICKSGDNIEDGQINLRICNSDRLEISPGTYSEHAGAISKSALELAVEDIKKGFIHNIVTCPIDKKAISSTGFSFPGHTEFFANSFEVQNHMMILMNDELKVGMVTGHVPLESVSNSISTELIESKISDLNQTLIDDFGISRPKIAVLGLNPHSGDNGRLGEHENDIIQPAIESSFENGIYAFGPFSPDGFFGSQNHHNFDAVLGMYHDQVLIPFKQLSFGEGINYTAGLPIIRTSPDHGTAYDIAGKGIANTKSLVNAIFLVNKVYRQRVLHMELNNNPLKVTEKRSERFSIGMPDLK